MLHLLLLLPFAAGHSPHDVASVLSLASDGSVLSNDSNLLAASVDQGWTWRYRTFFDGEPVCAFALEAEAWVVVAETGGLWSTEDAGATWEELTGPWLASACQEGETGWWLAGPDGLWSSADGLDWQLEADGLLGLPFALTETSGGAVLGTDHAGGLWRWTPGDEGVELLPQTGALGLGSFEETVILGREGAPPLRSEDGGDSWTELDAGPEDLRVLHLDGERILGATATEAVWLSEDGGATWLLEDEGLDELAEGSGGPGDSIHYFHLRTQGSRDWLASFEGLYWRPEGEGRWLQAPIDTIPRVRSVAWQGDGTLLVGSYGGGVYRGTPGAQDWTEVAAMVGWPFPKQVVRAGGDPDHLFVVSGSALYRSTDGGLSWDTPPVRLGEAGDAVAPAPTHPADPRLAVAGRSGEGKGSVAWSGDAGESWTVAELPGDCRLKPTSLIWTAADELWVACGTEGLVSRSTDGGQSWSGILTLEAQVNALVHDGEHLWLGSADGLWRLDEGGAEQVALAGETLTTLAVDGDRLWLGVVERGLVAWSELEGLEEEGWPEGDYVEEIAVDAEGSLAVGLRSGAWWRTHEGAWALACPYDRLDDELQHWWWDSSWATVSSATAMRERARVGGAGARAELVVDGVQLRLLGEVLHTARLELRVDGEVHEVALDRGSSGLLWGLDLEAGVHELHLEVLEGSVRLDGAERWRADPPALPAEEQEEEEEEEEPGVVGPTPRCGCGGGAGALVLLVLPWRRRRSRG